MRRYAQRSIKMQELSDDELRALASPERYEERRTREQELMRQRGTGIHDGCRSFVAVYERRKLRSKPKPRRFANLKVGDWLTGGPWECVSAHDGRKRPPTFFLVTAEWYDYADGFCDKEAGRYVAIQRLRGISKVDGKPVFDPPHKHTRRGLAANRYQPSPDHDPIATLLALLDGIKAGSVIRIGSAKRASRSRLPSHRI